MLLIQLFNCCTFQFIHGTFVERSSLREDHVYSWVGTLFSQWQPTHTIIFMIITNEIKGCMYHSFVFIWTAASSWVLSENCMVWNIFHNLQNSHPVFPCSLKNLQKREKEEWDNLFWYVRDTSLSLWSAVMQGFSMSRFDSPKYLFWQSAGCDYLMYICFTWIQVFYLV